jgi:hypothetical protein
MKVLTHVNLGEAFESLKKTLIETEKQVAEDKTTVLDAGLKYANAYGRLSAAVEHHIFMNTDTNLGFIRQALESPENGSNEAPTILLHEK